MEKQQAKGIIVKDEIKKEKVTNFPYFLVTAPYSNSQDYHFLISVDYSQQSTVLSVYPYKQDMTRQPTCTIVLTDILTKKAVSTLYVSRLAYKDAYKGVVITEAEFIIGHRSGQIALIQYKDKSCKILQRLNKSLKGEGFFSKTSSLIFGGQETYTTFLREPIKDFQTHEQQTSFNYSYQAGNTIMLMKQLSQSNESAFFTAYESNNSEAYAFHYDLNSPAQKGSLTMFGCNSYYALSDKAHKVASIKFNFQVSSYVFLNPTKKEIAVALSSKQSILIIDTVKFVLKRTIQTQMSVRRLNYFVHQQVQYLTIMFYENYALLYKLNERKYCKLTGHRSFVANVAFDPKQQMLVSAGMDHRISLAKLTDIKEQNWIESATAQHWDKLVDSDCPSQRFSQIFSLGEYNNVRTNLHSYGYSNIFLINECYCMPTYDAKVITYKYV